STSTQSKLIINSLRCPGRVSTEHIHKSCMCRQPRIYRQAQVLRVRAPVLVVETALAFSRDQSRRAEWAATFLVGFELIRRTLGRVKGGLAAEGSEEWL